MTQAQQLSVNHQRNIDRFSHLHLVNMEYRIKTPVLPWKILPIDLSERLSDIPFQEGYAKTYAVFWWKNIPLGHQAIAAEKLPMSALEIANIAAEAIAPTIGSYLLAE